MKTFLSTACAVALMTSPRPPLPTHGRIKAARGSEQASYGWQGKDYAPRRDRQEHQIPPGHASSRRVPSLASMRPLRATSRRPSDDVVGRLRPQHRERTNKISSCAAICTAALMFAMRNHRNSMRPSHHSPVETALHLSDELAEAASVRETRPGHLHSAIAGRALFGAIRRTSPRSGDTLACCWQGGGS